MYPLTIFATKPATLMDLHRDYYAILHVNPEAPREIIKSSYRTLMQRLRMHPDLGGESSQAAIINEAYRVLIEPGQRALYDKHRVTAGARGSRGDRETVGRAPENRGDWSPDKSAGICKFCRARFPLPEGAYQQLFCPQCDSPQLMLGKLHDYSEDRRTILRVHKYSSLQLHTIWPQSQAVAGRTQDISLTGMRFRTGAGLRHGQVLKVDMQVLRGIVEVTRIARHGSDWEVGAKFLSLHFERSRGAFVAHCV